MDRRTADLTTLDAFAFAGVAIAIAEGTKQIFASAAPAMAAFCLLSVLISVRLCWPLRARRWFIPFFVTILLIHIPIAVIGGSLPIKGFYLLMTPLVGLDVLVVVWAALKVDDFVKR